MLKVGITGGIGSGKSLVCQVFHTLGIPVFNADLAARHLMENDADLIASIKALLGNEVYIDNRLDRAKVSAIVYAHSEKLQHLNALVHPATIRYANEWFQLQSAPYVIKEAAIFFETGSNRDMDTMIGVYAPLEVRVARTMKRGSLTREDVFAIIAKQMNEDEKMKQCDHIITNDDNLPILPQVLEIDKLLRLHAVGQS